MTQKAQPIKKKPPRKKVDPLVKKKAAMLLALEQALGVVTTACKIVNIPRRTFYNWIKTDERFAEDVEDIQEIALDFAESQLHKQIKGGNITGIIFYLKTKGKKRGYVERTEIANINAPAFVVKPEQKGVMKVLKSVDERNKQTGT